MQYRDLKEMTIKEWDGQPFDAYVTDVKGAQIEVGFKGTISGYKDSRWFTQDDCQWNFVYPVEWNKDKVEEALNPKHKRMTNRQLAKWLAKGNGECSYNNTVYYLNAYGYHCYDMRHANDFVDEHIRVRKWDSEEWIEPTVDLLENAEKND